MLRLAVLLLLCCLAPTVLAQADCPAIVTQAFESVKNVCEAATARNQACYGNFMLNATPQGDAADFRFEQVGDITDVDKIQSLQLSSMNLNEGQWGVVLMNLQANVPDTLPGQGVTFLLFGDVQITNAVQPSVALTATATGNVNIRRRPTTEGDNVIGSLSQGGTVTANGRLADGAWIRIETSGDSQGQTGWVSAALLSSDGDLNSLDVVAPDSQVFGPMQAFYLKTGFRDRPCAEAPESGILVQGPKGIHVHLNVNGIDVTMRSTLYLQTTETATTYNVVEGQATVTEDGVNQFVPAGSFTSVETDFDDYNATGTPEFPAPYDDGLLELPVDLLPEEIDVAPALEADAIDEAIQEALGDTEDDPALPGDAAPDDPEGS